MKNINNYENLWIGFLSNSGMKYINPATGRYRSEAPMNGYIYKFLFGQKEAILTIIIKENENLIVSNGEIKLTDLKLLGKPISFRNVNTYIFDKNKKMIDSSIEKKTSEIIRGTLVGDFSKNLYTINEVFKSTLIINADGSCNTIKTIKDLNNIFSLTSEKKISNKEQIEIDKFVTLTPEVNTILFPFREKGNNKIATIERINSETPCCCLRNFTYTQEKSTQVIETLRIYIFKDKIISAQKNNFNEYVFTTLKKVETWHCPLVEIKPEVGKGTKLEYYTSIANEIIPFYRTEFLFLCLNHPSIESLYKSGYRNITSAILELKDFSRIIGPLNNEKNLYKSLGMNKYQLSKLDELCNAFGSLVLVKPNDCVERTNINCSKEYFEKANTKAHRTPYWIVPCIKQLVETNNISDLDNNTFDVLSEITKNPNVFEICKLYKDIYSLESFLDKKEYFMKWEKYMGNSYSGIKNIFIDTLNMIKDLNLQNHIKINFENQGELLSAHDYLASAYKTEINSIKLKKFEENCMLMNEYKFSSEKYTIVIPHAPSELAIEGVELHHCVKSYINKVVDGITNIVFIRQKEDINIPFFTVEIQKGTIMQIHGINNCNVSTPSLKKFIHDWTETRHLKTNEKGYNILR